MLIRILLPLFLIILLLAIVITGKTFAPNLRKMLICILPAIILFAAALCGILFLRLFNPFLDIALKLLFLMFVAIAMARIISLPWLRKVTTGMLPIVAAWFVAMVSGFFFSDAVGSLLALVLLGMSPALLYLYANHSAGQLLGSLGIFSVLFCGLSLMYTDPWGLYEIVDCAVPLIYTAIPWLVSIAIGAFIRRYRAKKTGFPPARE